MPRKSVKLYTHHHIYQEIIIDETSRLPVSAAPRISVNGQPLLSEPKIVTDGMLFSAVAAAARLLYAVCFHSGLFLLKLWPYIKKAARIVGRFFYYGTEELVRAVGFIFSAVHGQWRLVAIRQSFRFTFVLFLFLVVAGMGVVHSGVLVSSAVDRIRGVATGATLGVSDLMGAQDQLRSQQLSGAENKFSDALAHFEQSQEELKGMGIVLNTITSAIPQKKQAAGLLEAARLVSSSGLSAARLANQLKGVRVSGQGIEGFDGAKLLPQIQKTVHQLTIDMARINELLAGVNESLVPDRYRLQFVEGRQRMESLVKSFGVLDLITRTVVQMLLGDKQALVILQNNNELRATGGFIGTLGSLSLSDGKIQNLNIRTVYDYDGQLRQYIEPPYPLRVVGDRWFLRDSNWFFDFPTSAKIISEFYEKEGGETPDLIIACTAQVMVDLLKVTGPIKLSAYDVQLSAENFIEQTQVSTSLAYDKIQNNPKQLLADAFPVLMNRLGKLEPADMIRILASLQNSLVRKDIMFYSRDPLLAENFARLSWDGSVKQVDRDYLAVVGSNLGGTKTDLYQQDVIDVSTVVTENDSVTNTVTLQRTNSLPVGASYVNKSFVRVYVPLGSRLESADGFDVVAVPSLPQGTYRSNSQVEVWQGSLQQSLVNGVWIGEESGKTIFGGWVVTSGGQTKKISVRYRLPFSLGTLDHYSLTVQRQSGSGASKFSHTLDLGLYRRLWSAVNYQEESSRKLKLNATLKQDLFMGFVIQK